VRQIKDEVLFPPNGGHYKVYIIDEVHMLSNSAFNALLKTIEEPPPYIVFIFATTELHKVPATIKSRGQQFNFRLIPVETIRDILKNTCAEMGLKAEEEALFWIAKESTGSLRDAYTLFDQVASFSEGNIRAALIREKLGLLGLDTLNALAETCAANDTTGAFTLVDKILDSGVAIEQFVVDLAGYYRSLLLLKNGVTRESLLGYSPDRFSPKVREVLDSPHLERALDLLLGLYRDIRYSVSPRFELETVVSKLSWLNHWVSPPELHAAIAQARRALNAETIRGPGGDQGIMAWKPAAPDPAEQEQGGEIFGTPEAEERPDETGEPAGRQEVFDTPLQIGKPGSLSEEFKRLMAAKEAAGQETPADIPPQAEMVRRMFHGKVVQKK
jgi:DNA polymerase-3 subunit gamma/tau